MASLELETPRSLVMKYLIDHSTVSRPTRQLVRRSVVPVSGERRRRAGQRRAGKRRSLRLSTSADAITPRTTMLKFLQDHRSVTQPAKQQARRSQRLATHLSLIPHSGDDDTNNSEIVHDDYIFEDYDNEDYFNGDRNVDQAKDSNRSQANTSLVADSVSRDVSMLQSANLFNNDATGFRSSLDKRAELEYIGLTLQEHTDDLPKQQLHLEDFGKQISEARHKSEGNALPRRVSETYTPLKRVSFAPDLDMGLTSINTRSKRYTSQERAKPITPYTLSQRQEPIIPQRHLQGTLIVKDRYAQKEIKSYAQTEKDLTPLLVSRNTKLTQRETNKPEMRRRSSQRVIELTPQLVLSSKRRLVQSDTNISQIDSTEKKISSLRTHKLAQKYNSDKPMLQMPQRNVSSKFRTFQLNKLLSLSAKSSRSPQKDFSYEEIEEGHKSYVSDGDEKKANEYGNCRTENETVSRNVGDRDDGYENYEDFSGYREGDQRKPIAAILSVEKPILEDASDIGIEHKNNQSTDPDIQAFSLTNEKQVMQATRAKRWVTNKDSDHPPHLTTPSQTKQLFKHFAKCNISQAVLHDIEIVADKFWNNLIADLGMYCRHAKRKTINQRDMQLLMHRQGLTSNSKTMYSLVERFMPIEYRELIIPVAKSGNVVKPKPKIKHHNF